MTNIEEKKHNKAIENISSNFAGRIANGIEAILIDYIIKHDPDIGEDGLIEVSLSQQFQDYPDGTRKKVFGAVSSKLSYNESIRILNINPDNDPRLLFERKGDKIIIKLV